MTFRALGLLVPLACVIVAAPIASDAQPPTKVARIGILRVGSPPDPYREAFRQGLHELGYAIPIVMPVTTDPVGAGLVASLARPGGNITGLATLTEEMAGKWL